MFKIFSFELKVCECMSVKYFTILSHLIDLVIVHSKDPQFTGRDMNILYIQPLFASIAFFYFGIIQLLFQNQFMLANKTNSIIKIGIIKRFKISKEIFTFIERIKMQIYFITLHILPRYVSKNSKFLFYNFDLNS